MGKFAPHPGTLVCHVGVPHAALAIALLAKLQKKSQESTVVERKTSLKVLNRKENKKKQQKEK